MTTRPYSFQLDAIRKIHRLKGRALIAFEMGLGKTVAALLHLQRHPELRPAIIVCPASIKWQWETEALKHIGQRAFVLDGTKPALGMPTTGKLFIVNYDILIQRRMDKGKKTGEGWLRWLRDLRPQCIIIDEAHFIGNMRAARTKAVRDLCKGVPSVLALSGTPLTNRPAELWPTLNILWPKSFPSFWPFAHDHCGMRRTPWGWDWSGASRLEVLHAKMVRLGMLRRLKKDVLTQLPKKTRQIVPLPLEQQNKYDEAVTDFRKWLVENLEPGQARKAMNAETLTKLSYLRRLAAEQKMPAVFDWIDTWLKGSEGKLIVFGWHKDVIARLHARWKKSSVFVTGEVVGRKRQEAVNAFQKSKDVRLFLGNIDAAGVGLNLTAASAVAFAELPWSPGKCVQAEDRAHRIGQRSSVSVSYLVARGTIEDHLAQILSRKQVILDKTLDGQPVDGSLRVHEMLLEIVGGFPKNGLAVSQPAVL